VIERIFMRPLAVQNGRLLPIWKCLKTLFAKSPSFNSVFRHFFTLARRFERLA
jgi:hypothetical protein